MILIYLLKVSACTALFFAAYWLLLSKLTFFKLNRTYLLFALIMSFIIPALTIESKHEVMVSKQPTELKVAYSNDTSFEKDVLENGNSTADSLNVEVILEYAYYIIFAVLLIKTLFAIGYINYALRKFRLSRIGSIVFVEKHSKIKNCSFLNRIVVDASLGEEAQGLVIQHELVHVKQLHSFDKLIMNFAVCILWFNPIIYLWRIAMDNNHEFLADETIVASNDKKIYASLLLNLASPANGFATNNFSQLSLKTRIKMMYKRPNNPLKKLTYLAIIPILSFCCLAFINRKDIMVEKEIAANDGGKHLQVLPDKSTTVNKVAELTNQNDSLEKPVAKERTVFNQNLLEAVAPNNSLELDNRGSNLSVNTEIKDLVTGKEVILVVDAGHGGQDGASKSQSGIAEKDLNLRAAQILKEEAEKRSIKVILTRDKDKLIPLRDRLPNENATAFISIHHNSMPKPNMKVQFDGIEVFVSKQNPNIKSAEQFGSMVLKNLNSLSGIIVRDSLKDANLLLLRESKIPAVVVELGNISNEKSLAYVSDEANLRRISNLILDGFLAFSKS
ncbi:MAG: hypothetical protein EOP55_01800 [Sphingobacteriales bacterium]|nr:MAG: hypothetical protein EOP55_01800 [Sphingobacteriales bacterium]